MDTNIQPLDWFRLFVGEAPVLYYAELALRIVMLFMLLLFVLRLLGKREQDSLSPMQQMLMIALGSAAGDVMLYPQISIGYAVFVLIGMSILTVLLEKTADAFRPVRDYVESRPTVLVREGEVDFDALDRERTTERELSASLRLKGAVSLSQVDLAVLEVTGGISVVLNDKKPKNRDLLDYLLDASEHSPVSREHRRTC
jgi:uncharacterized membrane protein YcaP (DUF421 family)